MGSNASTCTFVIACGASYNGSWCSETITFTFDIIMGVKVIFPFLFTRQCEPGHVLVSGIETTVVLLRTDKDDLEVLTGVLQFTINLDEFGCETARKKRKWLSPKKARYEVVIIPSYDVFSYILRISYKTSKHQKQGLVLIRKASFRVKGIPHPQPTTHPPPPPPPPPPPHPHSGNFECWNHNDVTSATLIHKPLRTRFFSLTVCFS